MSNEFSRVRKYPKRDNDSNLRNSFYLTHIFEADMQALDDC